MEDQNTTMAFDTLTNRYILQGTLTTVTGLHIGVGDSLEPIGTDSPIIRDADGQPYIPGSSFKGVLRARIEALVRTIGQMDNAVVWSCNPVNNKEWCVVASMGDEQQSGRTSIESLKDEARRDAARTGGEEDAIFTEKLMENTCTICRILGSPWFASKTLIKDLYIAEDFEWTDDYEVRDGVGIDRDTETAADGVKYDYEVVPAGTRFSLEIVVENADDWELGLLLLGLRDFENELVRVGGITSRGLGVVRLDWKELEIVEAGEDSFWSYLRTGKGEVLTPKQEEPEPEPETEVASTQSEPTQEELEKEVFEKVVQAVQKAKESESKTDVSTVARILSEEFKIKKGNPAVKPYKNMTGFLKKAVELEYLTESGDGYDVAPKAESTEENPEQEKSDEPEKSQQEPAEEQETLDDFIQEKIDVFIKTIEEQQTAEER